MQVLYGMGDKLALVEKGYRVRVCYGTAARDGLPDSTPAGKYLTVPSSAKVWKSARWRNYAFLS